MEAYGAQGTHVVGTLWLHDSVHDWPRNERSTRAPVLELAGFDDELCPHTRLGVMVVAQGRGNGLFVQAWRLLVGCQTLGQRWLSAHEIVSTQRPRLG
jgi:hypothetical protein